MFDFKGDFARQMDRNLKTLFELQDRRKAEEREQARNEARPKTKAATASNTYEENGFAFSITQTPPPAPETTPPSEEKIAA